MTRPEPLPRIETKETTTKTFTYTSLPSALRSFNTHLTVTAGVSYTKLQLIEQGQSIEIHIHPDDMKGLVHLLVTVYREMEQAKHK